MRKKGVVSRKKEARRAEGGGHLFPQKGEHAGQLRAASYLQWSAESEQKSHWIQSACCLSHCVYPTTTRTHTLRPTGHGHLRDSTESLCLPLSILKGGTDLAPKSTDFTDIFKVWFPDGDWMTSGPQLS